MLAAKTTLALYRAVSKLACKKVDTATGILALPKIATVTRDLEMVPVLECTTPGHWSRWSSANPLVKCYLCNPGWIKPTVVATFKVFLTG